MTGTHDGEERQSRPAEYRTPRWAFMSRFIIPNLDDPTETYLTRWRIVQTPWFSLFLHRMDGPDSRPTLHDHPWSFLSIVLRGGYIERRLDPLTRQVDEHRTVRRVNLMRTHDAHAIRSLLRVPTWTLLLVGARRRTWGYIERSDPRDSTVVRWTEFSQHRYDAEFKAALAARASLSGSTRPGVDQ